MRKISYVMALAVTAAVGCDRAPTATAQDAGVAPNRGADASARAHLDLREERASLLAADEALAAATRAGGIAAFGASFADDIVLLSGRAEAVQGAAAARQVLATHPNAPKALDWHTLRADVSSDGAHGYTISQGTFTVAPAGTPQTIAGHFLAYWKRAADGDWKLAAWVYNSRAEAQPAVPAAFATPDEKHRRTFPHADAAADREAVKAADAAFAAYSVRHGTGPAFQAFAAPTAMILGGQGQLVFGPEAIGPEYVSPDVVDWAPIHAVAAPSGDLGFTVGYATFTSVNGAKRYTKYLTVWQKQDTGEWLYVSDNGNSRPAP